MSDKDLTIETEEILNIEEIDEEHQSVGLMKIFDIVDKYGSKALGDEWNFYPLVDVYNKPEKVDLPAISYRVDYRKHFKQSHRKPSYIDRTSENNESNDGYTIFGETFDSIISFGFWSKNYRLSNNYRRWFEQFIYQRKKEFKKLGIVRFVFEEQEEDQDIELNGNYYCRQLMKYKVIHPRITRVPYDNIKDINTSGINVGQQNPLYNTNNQKDDFIQGGLNNMRANN